MSTARRTTCAKCGGDDVSTRYHKQGCSDPYGSYAKQHAEHLHYLCRTCQWDWIGATVDRERGPETMLVARLGEKTDGER